MTAPMSAVPFPDFAGAEYSPTHDDFRLRGQLARVFDVMVDGGWRTLDEIAHAAHAPAASVSAQLRHLRKERFGAHTVDKRHRGPANCGLYEYRLIVNEEAT
jgi:hypothetical protein